MMSLKRNPLAILFALGMSLLLIASISEVIEIDQSNLGENNVEQLPSVQGNYENSQLNLESYVWNTLGYSGDSNASIAIIGTGLDSSHSKFGYDSYGDKDFTKKIVGWKDFVNESNLNPVDPQGLSTFTAVAAFGNNDSNSAVSIDAENRTTLTLGGSYLQSELFPTNPGPGTFELKLATVFIDQDYANITLNATFFEYSSNFIQDASFQIRQASSIVNETIGDCEGIYKEINYSTGINDAIYNVYFKYRLGFASPANFSIRAILQIPLEYDIDYSGLAPNTKLVGLRVLDKNLKGNISSLVSALNWIKNNRDVYQIVGVQIDLGNYFWDISESELSVVVEEVIQSGIMIFIPAGDDGIVTHATNPIITNDLPIVVGSVNDIGELTYYTSLGDVDVLAPGGSYLISHRTILAADSNNNDALGYLPDFLNNITTSKVGTSISSALVAASYNILIEALGGYSVWETLRSNESVLMLKSRILMTASELNQNREDDPQTSIIDESGIEFSPILNRGMSDNCEGFGIINIPAAIESLIKELTINSQLSDSIVPVAENITGFHSFARYVQLTQNQYYHFDLTHNNSTDLDFYLYSNTTDQNGVPILVEKSVAVGFQNESLVFGLEQETGVYILVVKAISGELTDFTLNVTHLPNTYVPTLTNHSVDGIQGYNDTLDTFQFIINYTDLDGLPPITLSLNISEYTELIPFSKMDSDINYTDGSLYSTEFRFYEIGEYEYHIEAWDGATSVKAPSIGNYTVEVLPIENAIYNNYSCGFSSMDKWETVGDWNNISQSNLIDPRDTLDSEWEALYFGDISSIASGSYSYENLDESSISTVYSPQFWLNDSSSPLLQMGSRISVSSGDYLLINIRSNRTGSWESLDSFTNYEAEWSILEYNLSDYLSTYIQIQFVFILDLINDDEQNKGVMIDDFNLLQEYPLDHNPTNLFNASISPEYGPIYQEYRFSTIVGDQDGSTPEIVYLEIDQENYTMFNIFGDFDSKFVLDNNTLVSGGISYAYDLYLATISNSRYRFHVHMNGNITTSEFFEGPNIEDGFNASFPYYGVSSNMNVYGNPRPHPETIWVSSRNSFHYITSDEVWYAGEGLYQGYGYDWDVYMVTSLIYIPPSNEETDRVYLWFEHQLVFDSTFPTLFGDDYAQIMISSDYGAHWYELEVYEEDVVGFQSQKIDLWNYKGREVLIRFEFHSDSSNFLPSIGTGWYIREISVNVDEDLDKEPPTVIFTNIIPNMVINETFTLEITILDPSGIDDDLVKLFINTVSIDDAVCENGVIIYELDTSRFRNGNTTISVLALDLIGNQELVSTYVIINNQAENLTWVYIIIGVAVVLISTILIFYYQFYQPTKRKRELAQEMLTEEDKQRLLEEQKARELEEIRIREQAEMATSESEALKPFKYKCNRCSKQFENMKYIWSLECPDCETDTLELEYQCKLCGKYYYFDMLGEYHCKECNIKLLK